VNNRTRLYLIRHGETVDAAFGRYKGHRDVALNDTGRHQMELIARWLREKDLAGVYASTLQRTVAGAEMIARGRNLRVKRCDELKEMNFGAWEGMTAGEIEESYPGALDDWMKKTLDYRMPGGESMRDVRDRVLPVIHDIVRTHEGGDVALVAHGGVNRVILAAALGIDVTRFYAIGQDYGCVNIIDYHPGLTVVSLMNGGPVRENGAP